MEAGALAAAASAILAWLAPDLTWFYGVFILAGVANVALWTIAISMTLEFGTLAERPAYIGLANTLIAPFTILVPVVGGSLVGLCGSGSAFALSAVGSILMAVVLHALVRNPRQQAEVAVRLFPGD